MNAQRVPYLTRPFSAALAALMLAAAPSRGAAPGQPAPPARDEKAAVAAAIRDSIEWAADGKNTARLFGSVAHDAEFFIFHPDSRSTVVGYEAFESLARESWLDPDFRATSSEIRDLRVNLSRSGDVGWFTAMLDDCGEWKGKPGCWRDTRWSGVLEKRDGRWVIVQMHFSFASDKRPDGSDRVPCPTPPSPPAGG